MKCLRVKLDAYVTVGALTAWLIISNSAIADQQTSSETVRLPSENSECVFSGQFTQARSLAGLAKPIDSNGVFYYHCEHGVIWKTLGPVPETIVFQRGGDSIKFKETGDFNKLKSRQGKLLGRLLNDLISLDTVRLADSFKLENLSDVSIRLTPRKRRLKRALQYVDVTSNSDDSISIHMLDRNQQSTKVNSAKTARFASLSSAIELHAQCNDDAPFSMAECTALLGSQLNSEPRSKN